MHPPVVLATLDESTYLRCMLIEPSGRTCYAPLGRGIDEPIVDEQKE